MANSLFDFLRRLKACLRPLRVALTGMFFLFAYSLSSHADDLVVIEGLTTAQEENVRAFLGFAEDSCESPSWRLESLYDEAEDEIQDALEVFGYYNSSIKASESRQEGCPQFRFEVSAGELVRFSSVRVVVQGEGASAKYWQDLSGANPLRVGEPLVHSEYESYRQRFDAISRRYGYFDSKFLQREVRVYPESNTAEVEIVFDTGIRYSFGELTYEQEVLDEELLSRFVEFKTGELYDSYLIAELYEALLITGYFSTVDIVTSPRIGEVKIVDATLSAIAAKPSTWTAGLGYGTDTGPQISLGYLNRRQNTSGHQWGANASASRVIKQIGVNYRIPLDEPRAEWFNIDAGYKDENTETSTSQLAKAGVKRLQLRGRDWLETQFIDVSNEDYILADSAGSTFLVVPGISWNRVEMANLSRPRSGYRVSFQVSGTAEAIGSDISFVQTLATGKVIFPLPGRMRVLSRLDLGTTWTGKFQELPASLRFFAGGDFSVRGYDYKSLGPADENGSVIGGDNLIVGSVEIDRPIWGNWSVAAFADAGNAFNNSGNLNLKVGVGGGLRWYSPVGPIRVDLAFPLADDATDDFRLHITLSPDL